MKEEITIKALDIIEREAGSLRRELEKGKELEWKDVKIILGGLALLAGDERIQEEAGKKVWWAPSALSGFAAVMKKL